MTIGVLGSDGSRHKFVLADLAAKYGYSVDMDKTQRQSSHVEQFPATWGVVGVAIDDNADSFDTIPIKIVHLIDPDPVVIFFCFIPLCLLGGIRSLPERRAPGMFLGFDIFEKKTNP